MDIPGNIPPYTILSVNSQREDAGFENFLPVDDIFEPFTTSSFKDLSHSSSNETQEFYEQLQSNYLQETPSDTSYDSEDKSQKTAENWRLRITIPEPFNMTIREEIQEDNKPKVCRRYRKDLELHKGIDEVECGKVFRANPIPPGTFYPLYEEMVRQEETRRLLRKEKSRELTLVNQKPFNFYFREEVKKFLRSRSMPNLNDSSSRSEKHSKVTPSQRHKRHRSVESPRKSCSYPVKKSNSACIPRSINFDPTLSDMSLRNIRSKLQASRDWTLLMKWSEEQKRSTAVKRILDPPNFKAIHADLAKKQQKQFPIKVTTSCEPFALHTSTIPSHIEKIKEDIKQDAMKLKETRWPFTAPRAPFRYPLSNSKVPLSPPKLNLAAKLRVETKSKQMANRNEEKKNAMWKHQLRRTLSEKIAAEVSTEPTEEKIRRRRMEIKSQLLDYQFELDEMTKRVASRPLLMEQQSAMAARKRAERIFLEKLRDQGLTEEFVMRKSKLAMKENDSSATSTLRTSSSATVRRSRSDTSSKRGSMPNKEIQALRESLNSQGTSSSSGGDDSLISSNSNDTPSQ